MGIPPALMTFVAILIAAATVVVVGIGFHLVIKRWQAANVSEIEHFFGGQVSMINNATQAQEEMPIFFPYPVTPKKNKENDAKKPPKSAPETTQSPPPTPSPPMQPPPSADPEQRAPSAPGPSRSPGPAAVDAEQDRQAAMDDGDDAARIARNANKVTNPYCITPQFVVCEVAPQPVIAINAFRYDGAPESKVESLGPFNQPNQSMQPTFSEEGKTKFFVFDDAVNLNNTKKDIDVPINSGRNGGCSIVSVIRCSDLENSDFVMTTIDKMYTMKVDDFRYYITRNTWCLLMVVYKEKDKGTSYSTFLDDVANGEELRVSQTQDSLLDTNINKMIVGDPMKQGNQSRVDIAYLAVYDRALTPYERQLIRASCKDILISPAARTTDPKVVADYDVTEITDERLSASKDMRRTLKDSSASKFDLLYNVYGKDAVFNTKSMTKYVELSKNDKFFSPTSNFIDMTDGYTMELFFYIRQFSTETDSVVMCYSALQANVRTPQIIMGITSSTFGTNTQVEGNRFTVIYAADMQRFQSQTILSINKWYHVVFTSESKMYINGEKVDTYGRALVTLPLVANQARYITVGDYMNADGSRVSTDAGRTMNGFFGLGRIYNYPLNPTAVRERYTVVKNSNGGGNVYGLP
jgi:hypothetical protein